MPRDCARRHCSSVTLARRTSCASSTRLVYCAVGRCDVDDLHADIITSVEDFLWLKLCHVADSAASVATADAPPHDVISLPVLQKLIYEDYG